MGGAKFETSWKRGKVVNDAQLDLSEKIRGDNWFEMVSDVCVYYFRQDRLELFIWITCHVCTRVAKNTRFISVNLNS